MIHIKQIPWKAKFKAMFVHIGLSLLVFLLILWWLMAVLYPSFYFNMSGGVQGVTLMFWVDVVLGPFLTFLVFNPKKSMREKCLDCVVVGLVQLSALGYGMNTVYREHPKFLVLYEYGTATTITQREFLAEPENFGKVDWKQLTPIAGLPTAVYREKDKKMSYLDLKNAPADVLQKANRLTREAMSPEELAQLKPFEQNGQSVYVFGVMGKYTGAYVVVDKDFNFLSKIGEKPVGL